MSFSAFNSQIRSKTMLQVLQMHDQLIFELAYETTVRVFRCENATPRRKTSSQLTPERTRSSPLIAWRTCCLPFEEGGLGLKQLVVLNRSLLLKRCWEIFSSNAAGCAFIRARFCHNGVLRRSYAASSIWPGVKKFWPTVVENGRWLIGSGTIISFWKDNFLGQPLHEFLGAHAGMVGGLGLKWSCFRLYFKWLLGIPLFAATAFPSSM